jgi:hypothetical protein
MIIRLISYKNLLKFIRCVFTKIYVPLDIDFSLCKLNVLIHTTHFGLLNLIALI